MPLRSGLICARLTGSARRGMGGIVTLGSGTLPAGVPAAVVRCCPLLPLRLPLVGLLRGPITRMARDAPCSHTRWAARARPPKPDHTDGSWRTPSAARPSPKPDLPWSSGSCYASRSGRSLPVLPVRSGECPSVTAVPSLAVTVTRAPPSGRFCAHTRPPCAAAMVCTTASPSPADWRARSWPAADWAPGPNAPSRNA